MLLFFGLTNLYSVEETIFPRVEIVNKTQSNSIEVTEKLDRLIPKQKQSEIELKSIEYTTFKQKQAGDFVELQVKSFENMKFYSDFYKISLILHTKNSATFAFHDLDDNLVLSDINVKINEEIKVDIALNGKDDIVLGYLGYDTNELPAYKVKAHLPDDAIYYKGNYCEINNDEQVYDCYEESFDGTIEKEFQISLNDLQLLDTTIEDIIVDKVREEIIEEKNKDSEEEAKKNTTVGEQNSNIDWVKVFLIIVLVLLVIIVIFKGKKTKNNKSYNLEDDGDF